MIRAGSDKFIPAIAIQLQTINCLVESGIGVALVPAVIAGQANVVDLVEIGKGGISYRQVGRSLIGRSLQFLKETYQPGADTGRVALVHDGEEGGIIITGRLEVTVAVNSSTVIPVWVATRTSTTPFTPASARAL